MFNLLRFLYFVLQREIVKFHSHFALRAVQFYFICKKVCRQNTLWTLAFTSHRDIFCTMHRPHKSHFSVPCMWALLYFFCWKKEYWTTSCRYEDDGTQTERADQHVQTIEMRNSKLNSVAIKLCYFITAQYLIYCAPQTLYDRTCIPFHPLLNVSRVNRRWLFGHCAFFHAIKRTTGFPTGMFYFKSVRRLWFNAVDNKR